MKASLFSKSKVKRVEMNCCKKCHGKELVRNGHIRDQQAISEANNAINVRIVSVVSF